MAQAQDAEPESEPEPSSPVASGPRAAEAPVQEEGDKKRESGTEHKAIPRPRLSPEAPREVGRYRIICEIARGGMATVYLAHLGGLGGFHRLVAIKLLHPHLAGETEFVNMFLDEARLVASLQHPNVVPTLDVDQTDDNYYLVMEYVEGVPLTYLLRDYARRGERIPRGVTLRVMLDALAGLDAAHELRGADGEALGVVHRDVSPQNILVGLNGRSCILDFGIARARQRLTNTRVGQMKGKLAYMAPEQVKGKGVDRRVDVFAAGIVLWEALSGRRLFYGTNEADTLTYVMNGEIPSLRESVPDLPEELEAVVFKALERDPEKRYPSAKAFAEELEKVALKHDLLVDPLAVQYAVDGVAGDDLQLRQQWVREVLADPDDDPTLALAAPSEGGFGNELTGRGEVTDLLGLTETHGRAEQPTVDDLPVAKVGVPLWKKRSVQVAAGAALFLLGFLGVALAVGGSEDQAGEVAAPATAATEATAVEATAAPVKASPPEAEKTQEAAEGDTGASNPEADSETEEATSSKSKAKKPRIPPGWRGFKKQPAQPSTPKGPAPKGGGGLDLSNPYK